MIDTEKVIRFGVYDKDIHVKANTTITKDVIALFILEDLLMLVRVVYNVLEPNGSNELLRFDSNGL
jgi:hypothetical protein